MSNRGMGVTVSFQQMLTKRHVCPPLALGIGTLGIRGFVTVNSYPPVRFISHSGGNGCKGQG